MMEIQDIPDILDKNLTILIKRIAEQYNIQPFINNPDFLEPRVIKWHQFGLLTHTRKLREIFLNEMNLILEKWEILELINKILSEKIDNIEKRKLFEISIILHDLGKIICHNNTKTNRKHELASKNLIYENFLNQLLNSFGLTKNQIDYIARCVETHYVLGEQIRDILKENNNLRLDYLSKENIIDLCDKIIEDYKDVKTELGIFFICDNLAKTDIRIKADTDLEIKEQELEIMKILEQRRLPLELKFIIMQLPVNLKIAEIYLKLVNSKNKNARN